MAGCTFWQLTNNGRAHRLAGTVQKLTGGVLIQAHHFADFLGALFFKFRKQQGLAVTWAQLCQSGANDRGVVGFENLLAGAGGDISEQVNCGVFDGNDRAAVAKTNQIKGQQTGLPLQEAQGTNL